MTSFRAASFVLVVIAVASACDNGPLGANGVNDVKRSCEIRLGWTRAAESQCQTCIGAAAAPPCECEALKAFAGQCEEQGTARAQDPGCTIQIEQCALDCKQDCTCAEACYAKAPGCKIATAARDGCVTSACAYVCK